MNWDNSILDDVEKVLFKFKNLNEISEINEFLSELYEGIDPNKSFELCKKAVDLNIKNDGAHFLLSQKYSSGEGCIQNLVNSMTHCNISNAIKLTDTKKKFYNDLKKRASKIQIEKSEELANKLWQKIIN